MMRVFLLTVAVLCAVMCAGLVFGWEFLIFDDRTWRVHSTGWLGLSVAAFAGSCHDGADAIDKWLDRHVHRRWRRR